MAIRGSTSQVTVGNSITIAFPTGAIAGDLAILFTVHGYNVSIPSGWTSLYFLSGSTLNGLAASKVLNSTDIATGSVTVSAANSFTGVAAMAVFVGSGGGIRETIGNHGSGGPGSDTLTTSGLVLNTDTGIFFGAVRTPTPTITVAPGTTLQTPSDPNIAAVLDYYPMPGGALSATFTYNGAANGMFDAAVVAEVPTVVVPSQRGNIDYDQIRSSVRQGNAPYFQMFGGGTPVMGHLAVYDASGNVVDGGAPTGGFTAAGDLSGSSSTQTVIGLQTRAVASTAPTNGQVLTWSNAHGDWEPATVGTFQYTINGVPPSGPTIRGTGIQASSNSSYTVPWPAGTATGDLAILFAGHAWGANLPSGWTTQSNLTGSNWNGAVFSKTLTSGDISAGSVVVTFAGSFDGVVSVLTTVGNFTIKETAPSRNGTGSSSISLTTSTSALATDLLVYFGSNRGASTDTVSRGTMQRQANDGASASGCLYTETGTTGAISANFLYSSAGTGNYQSILIVG